MGTGCTSHVPSTPPTPHHLQQVSNGSCHLDLDRLLIFDTTCASQTIFLHFFQAPHMLGVLIACSVMPRERGNPKRGPSYYNFVSMQRRLHLLSQSPSTSLVFLDNSLVIPPPSLALDGVVQEPPMAIVEEEIPTVPIQIPPASLLYTVPNPQYPPPLTGCSTPGVVVALQWGTCIIEEEIPLEVHHEETLPPPSTTPE